MAPLLLITGGGTGGHVSPGLGVAAQWQKRHGQGTVAWVGKPGGIEAGMAERAGLPFHPVLSVALKRGLELSNLSLPLQVLRGWRQAAALIKAQRPAAVLMTGGYVGLPLGLAAVTAKVPLVLLEPNAVPGLANRLLQPLAAKLCLAYPVARPSAKTVVTGTPCRLDYLPSNAEAKRVLGLDPGKRSLLVLPGSQAARSINAALRGALPQLKDRAGAWQWIWMSGAAELEACKQAVHASPLSIEVLGFVNDVATAYAAADLVLCRSGASTLAELGVAAKPSLQVPYPHATGDHQRANARAFAAAGAAQVLDERDLDAASLEKALRGLLDSHDTLDKMQAAARALGKPQAAAAVTDELEAAAGLVRA